MANPNDYLGSSTITNPTPHDEAPMSDEETATDELIHAMLKNIETVAADGIARLLEQLAAARTERDHETACKQFHNTYLAATGQSIETFHGVGGPSPWDEVDQRRRRAINALLTISKRTSSRRAARRAAREALEALGIS